MKLSRLEEISRKFSGLCGLDYFSTEAAITESGDIFVIDYVNDQCDFRLKKTTTRMEYPRQLLMVLFTVSSKIF